MADIDPYVKDKTGRSTGRLKEWWGNSKIVNWVKDAAGKLTPMIEADPVSVTANFTNATDRFKTPGFVKNARNAIDELMGNLPWETKISRIGHKAFNQKKMMMDIVGQGNEMAGSSHHSPDFTIKSNMNASIDPRKTLLNAKSMLGDGYAGAGKSFKNNYS